MLFIVCALSCEARPFIEHFSLKAKTDISSFPIYQNEKITLAISGIGKINAAAAVGFLGQQDIPSCWINVGLAGHKDLAIGTSLLGHKIIDFASGKSFYPFFAEAFDIPAYTITTVDKPEKEYTENSAYDMEASGFFASACRFSTVELIHSYKVISDNKEHPFTLDAAFAQKLIEDKIPEIDLFIKKLELFRQEKEKTQKIPDLSLFSSFHFTATQKHNLIRLLKQCRSLNVLLKKEDVASFSSSKEVLCYLQEKIDQSPLQFRKNHVPIDLH